jgi:hypothetical protein
LRELDFTTANRVVAAAHDALRRLLEQESDPEFAARSAGWITPEDRQERLDVLARAAAWPCEPGRVTVSADTVSEAGSRTSGAVGDVAALAARKVLGERGRVKRLSPYAYTISWEE